jgi:hypothetical protein
MVKSTMVDPIGFPEGVKTMQRAKPKTTRKVCWAGKRLPYGLYRDEPITRVPSAYLRYVASPRCVWSSPSAVRIVLTELDSRAEMAYVEDEKAKQPSLFA